MINHKKKENNHINASIGKPIKTEYYMYFPTAWSKCFTGIYDLEQKVILQRDLIV